MSDEEAEYELVMPFVLTADHGGPYDPPAFVSGYRIGQLNMALALSRVIPHIEPTEYVGSPVEEQQLDLIAMQYGYKLRLRPFNEDWTVYRFEEPEEVEDLNV